MIGKTIGNYTITAQLGAGGMGEVFRARDSRLGRDVAIKILPDAFAVDPERLSRFEREARLLAGLNHPNIGAIYGLEELDGHRYLILELIEGENLAQRLQRGPVSLEDTLDFAQQISEALESAHEQGIVHRDLKPANIQITTDGRVKVLDFGLAKALDSSSESSPDLSHSPTIMTSSPTVAGVILGTAAYMSPEQARGKHVDKRADIFAFGVVVVELLTGRPVFAGETVSDTLAAVLRAEPDYDSLPVETPRALRLLLERCLDKNPRRRLRDIGEARIMIDDIRSGAAIDTPAATAPVPRRNIVRDIVPWVVVVAIAAFAIVRMQTAPPASVENASPPVRKMTMPVEHGALRCDPALSPDGNFIVYRFENQLLLRDLAALEPQVIAGTDGAVKPFWSPDSEWIGFAVEDKLMRVRRDGGQPALVGTLPGGLRMSAAASAIWTRDDRIVIGPASAGLQVVPARGGKITELLAPNAEDETDFHQICALPDDRGWIIVPHRNSGIGNLDVVLPDLTRKPILRIEEFVASPGYSPSGHVLFRRGGATPGVWAFAFSIGSLERTGEPFLVAADGIEPTVSSDGSLAYVIGILDAQAQLAILDRGGEVVSTLGDPAKTGRPYPSFSPDGRQIISAADVGDGRELFLYDVDRGTRRLTFNDLREDMVGWKRNGRDFYFYESSGYGTYALSIDGSKESYKIVDGIMASFSPDESEIAFARHRPGQWKWDIFVAASDGSNEREFINGDGVDWFPAFSPDGRYLAYSSSETGRDEVFVVPYPNATTRWQVSTEGGSHPIWRRDGMELFFTTHNHLWAADVSIGEGLTLGEPRQLFERPTTNWSQAWPDGYDVTADGQRFVMWKPMAAAQEANPAIVVVQNWFKEFE